MKIYEAIEHLTDNPRTSKKTLEATEILSDFAVWCEDQGHLDDYEEHYPNHDCQYDVEQAYAKFQAQASRTDGIYLLRLDKLGKRRDLDRTQRVSPIEEAGGGRPLPKHNAYQKRARHRHHLGTGNGTAIPRTDSQSSDGITQRQQV